MDSEPTEGLTQREPVTDLEYIVGYPVAVQRPTRVAMNPELAEYIMSYLAASRARCSVYPDITCEADARATMQAHRHHVGSPCLQKRAALAWMKDTGRYVFASQ
jgi:hypothetical protein